MRCAHELSLKTCQIYSFKIKLEQFIGIKDITRL
jgi:hypothetical protein